ncbi:MAG: diguanylate cyclase [Ferrovum sp.]|nr:diguanylate cyclase [Ferrovum sp.]
MSALLKRFVLICLPIIIVVSIVLLMVIRSENKTQLSSVLAVGNYEVEKAREQITKEIKIAGVDLSAIADLNDLRRYLDSEEPKQRAELERYLLLVSQKLQVFDKIRYLDASGQEVVRINNYDGKATIVPHHQLQNKSNRYFFRDTLNLNRGEMYVSPFDLSVEQGHLVVPHKPTIRFGTPVFDSSGRKKGVVLINYSGADLLQTFTNAMGIDDPFEDMLINRDGYWLSSSKHEDEWGFMLGKNERAFGHDFPEAWRAISTADQGSLLNAQGLFIYSTVYVLQPGQYSTIGSDLLNAPSQQQLGPHDYYWKIVFFVPNPVLFSKAFYNKSDFKILLGVTYLLFMLASFAIAYFTLKRKQGMDDLRIAAVAFETDEGILITDREARIIRTNHAFTRITGYSAAEAIGKTTAILHSGKQDATFYRNMWESLLRDKYWQGEICNKRKNGEIYTEWLTITAVSDAGGKVTNYVAVFADISERKQAEALLQASELRYRQLFENSRDALMSLAPSSLKFTTANQAAVKLFASSSQDELLALGPLDVSPEHQPDGRSSSEKAQEMIGIAMRDGSHFFEWQHQRLDGQPFAADVLLTRMEAGKETFLQANVRDISERKCHEEKIRQLAFYDTLTQLPNRRMFNDRLERATAASKRSGRYGALMFLDLDNFKPVNDNHGHEVGDLLLIEVAQRISRCVRVVDTVARFGGDEFMVMLSELDTDKAKSTAQAGIIAEKIRVALSESYLLIRRQDNVSETVIEHHCTASIGVVLFINQETSEGDLVKWADTAMYHAKENGRNQVCFHE